MTEEFNITAKQIGDELITISDSLASKMEKWSDLPTRPNDLSSTECVGFINKEGVTAGLDLVIDIQAPAAVNTATLRIWGIASTSGDEGERFNNIQLDFDMDYSVARAVTQKGEAVTRDDIRSALHDSATKLSEVRVSSQSGLDKVSQQPVGERYNATLAELDQDEDMAHKIDTALQAVLPALKDVAVA